MEERSINASVIDVRGIRALEFSGSGAQVLTAQDAINVIGEAMRQEAHLVLMPVAAFTQDFFRLSTRTAGDIVQKFVQYQQPLIIVGDIAQPTAESQAFAAFVKECNDGDHIWFVRDLGELEQKLESRGALA